MESIETQLLNKYNIPTLFPAQWPEEKDNSSDSEDDAPAPQRPTTLQASRRSKSRYSVLEPSGGFTRKRDGVEKTKEGVENLVQKDEQDPLGTYPSVVQVLRQRGLAVEDDIKLSTRALDGLNNGSLYSLTLRKSLPPKLDHLLALAIPLQRT